jgi:hypothetical protein
MRREILEMDGNRQGKQIERKRQGGEVQGNIQRGRDRDERYIGGET